jgi:hypothetical protein
MVMWTQVSRVTESGRKIPQPVRNYVGPSELPSRTGISLLFVFPYLGSTVMPYFWGAWEGKESPENILSWTWALEVPGAKLLGVKTVELVSKVWWLRVVGHLSSQLLRRLRRRIG